MYFKNDEISDIQTCFNIISTSERYLFQNKIINYYYKCKNGFGQQINSINRQKPIKNDYF